MKVVPDWSVGQRLATGFGLFMLVVAGMLIVFMRWYATSEAAHSAYAERIAPLRDHVHGVERKIYQVGIAFRSVWLAPSTDRVDAFSQSASEARAALEALRDSPMEADGRDLYFRMASAAHAYVQVAEGLVQQALTGNVDTNDERRIAEMREALMGDLGQFAVLQEIKAAAALQQIADVRRQTSRGLIFSAVITGVILSLLAWVTARSISQPTRRLLRTVSALREGNWKPALALAPTGAGATFPEVRDEMRQLGYAFGSAALALEQREQRLRADGLISQAVASSLQRADVASAALKLVMEHLRAEIGVVYSTSSDASKLIPVVSHALSRDLAEIELGDGIPGQAALERRAVIVTDIPPDSRFMVKLGYDQAIPKAVAAVPLTYRDTVHGVLVVASLREFSADAIAFLNATAIQMGTGLQNIAAYEQIQTLLTEVREYNERVQAQNEELQVQNEEIQAQNEEIQVQHEELQAQNEELLQQGEELRRHATQLTEADDRKNKFLGVLAHELRNPMAPIANSIHILKRASPGSDSALRAQAVIERQAAHLVRLIDDLLDVTRISEGKIHLKPARLDLVALSRVCVEDLTAAFEQSGITLELDLPNAPVEVHGDHTRLCQVLGNLLNNSIKFSDRGGTVQLSLRVDHGAGAAVLRVSDNGIGLEHDLLPKLFQPFSQGISGLARTKGGLGLGLALVRALVGLHEGTVSAHSDGPARGAEFTVRLPLASAQAALQREHKMPTLAAVPSRVRRVLIVEDNVDAARTLQEALRIEGYQVIAVHTGQEAFETLKTFSPDVVLCDIGLPDMDGHEIARAMRTHPQTESSILIALTGYASPEDKLQAASAGFDLHLAKPLKISGLEQILAGFK